MEGGFMAEAPYSTAKISIWWDIEDCDVSRAHSIVKNIRSSLVNVGYCGPIVSITAYGNINLINRILRRSRNSIKFVNVLTPGNDAKYRKILVDMLMWAVDNASPANCFLISDDADLAKALNGLSLKNYNILLAQTRWAYDAPLADAVWLWTSLRAGGPPLTESEKPHPYVDSDDSSPDLNFSNISVSESNHISKLMDKSPTMSKGFEFKKKEKEISKQRKPILFAKKLRLSCFIE